MDIDAVILWVDGNDIEWQKEKEKYYKQCGQDGSVNRYREWGTLKYLFRSIEVYAPWINNVYLVTCGHFPKWLNKECPKLKCVIHEEFIPKKYLPTFSSQAIDLNLWRIEELSEHFIYFNDDMFLTNFVSEADFFRKGLPCDMFSERPIFPGNQVFNYNMLNNLKILQEYYPRKDTLKKNFRKILNYKYGSICLYNALWCIMPFKKYCGLYMNHLPMSYLKSELKRVWKRNEDEFEKTVSHRFRDAQDINQFIFNMEALLSGKFYPMNMNKQGRLYSITDSNCDILCRDIERAKYKRICINDECGDKTFEEVSKKIIESFEKTFPRKSMYER